MKIIPIGLQCSVPHAIKDANLRQYSYPFDWHWLPSETTYNILLILLRDGIDKAIEYMTTGYTYYKYFCNEHYLSTKGVTPYQMNKHTGLGIVHFKINTEFKEKLKRRFERLLADIHSSEPILLIYADAANRFFNYYLDEKDYGVNATEYLIKIHDLLKTVKQDFKILYFCWPERLSNDKKITYIPITFGRDCSHVRDIIKDYLLAQVKTP